MMKKAFLLFGVLCAIQAAIFIVGKDRGASWSYCRYWHLTGEGSVVVGEFQLEVPDGWCPLEDDTEGVTLTSVPASRNDEGLVALVDSPIPERMKRALKDPPERTEDLAGQLTRVGVGSSRHELSGVLAFRMQYRHEEAGSGARDYVAWFFPKQDWMISSSRLPASKHDFFDDFVAELVRENHPLDTGAPQ
jgi:hypothetical protein